MSNFWLKKSSDEILQDMISKERKTGGVGVKESARIRALFVNHKKKVSNDEFIDKMKASFATKKNKDCNCQKKTNKTLIEMLRERYVKRALGWPSRGVGV